MWRLRPRISGAIRVGAIIVASVFVLVGLFEGGFGEAEASQESIAGSDGDFAFRRVQRIGRNGRMEDVHLVTPGYNVLNAEVAVRVGYRIVRSTQGDHHGAHLCVNVAEDKRNARLVELDKASSATLVEAKIETFSVEQRKHIVKKRILVGKLYFPAGWDYQQRRLETFIFLDELGDL